MKKIVCAALRSKNKVNDVPYLILGVRHFDEIMRNQIMLTFDCEDACKNYYWDQGFIDNKGQFHNRKEALKIAEAANQIIKKTGGRQCDDLYSEDLY